MLLKRYILTDNLAFRVWIVPMSKQVVVIKLQIITVLPYLYIYIYRKQSSTVCEILYTSWTM